MLLEMTDSYVTCCRYNEDLERVVRNRARRGRHFPVMRVIPPGLDFSNLKIAPPPDPLQQLMPGGPSLKSAGGSGNLTGRGRRRSSASSSWNHLAGAAGSAIGEELAPAGVGDSGGGCWQQCIMPASAFMPQGSLAASCVCSNDAYSHSVTRDTIEFC